MNPAADTLPGTITRGAGPNRRRLAVGLILLAGVMVYWNSLAGAFVFDDLTNLTASARNGAFWPPWEMLAKSTRPVAMVTFTLNYIVGGLNPWGYHLVNILIHLLAGLLLYGLVRRTLRLKRFSGRYDSAADSLALATALLWLVHPLQTESVTYLIQRQESLMGLFYLLTLYCVLRGASLAADTAPEVQAHRSLRRRWYAGAILACAAGMATKEVMVTAPVTILLFDRIFLSASWKELWQRRRWLYAGLGAGWLVLAKVMTAPEQLLGIGASVQTCTPWEYLLTQASVICHYLKLVFRPEGLCLDYNWPVTETLTAALPGLLVCGAFFTATVLALWQYPAAGFAGAWFFLILAPTSSVVPIADAAVEHRLYLPLAAVLVLLVVGGYEFGRLIGAWRRCRPAVESDGPVMPSWPGWVLFGFLVMAFGLLTIQRNRDYRSEIAIWNDTIATSPGNARAHYNLALALYNMGWNSQAITHNKLALKYKLDYAEAINNLGVIAEKQNRNEEALELFFRATRHKSGFADAWYNRGVVEAKLERYIDAIVSYRTAVKLNPASSDAYYNLGNCLSALKQDPEAAAAFRQALKIRPNYAGAHNNLGAILMKTGDLAGAAKSFAAALHYQPDFAEAKRNLKLVKTELAAKAKTTPGHPAPGPKP